MLAGLDLDEMTLPARMDVLSALMRREEQERLLLQRLDAVVASNGRSYRNAAPPLLARVSLEQRWQQVSATPKVPTPAEQARAQSALLGADPEFVVVPEEVPS